MMKKITCIFTLVCFLVISLPLYSQSGKELIKVSYIYTPLSPSMVSILRKQIPNPEQYQEAVNVIQRHKAFYSLYINTLNRESIFILDSIQAHPHVSTPGHTNYVFTNSDGVMRGSEVFMDSNVEYINNVKDIDWELSDDNKEISGYECQSATIKGNPDIIVWFTKDIAINKGPGYFQGLFGLTLEASDFFGTINANKVEYLDDYSIIEKLAKDVNKNKGKSLTLKEVLTLKQNMIRTLSTE